MLLTIEYGIYTLESIEKVSILYYYLVLFAEQFAGREKNVWILTVCTQHIFRVTPHTHTHTLRIPRDLIRSQRFLVTTGRRLARSDHSEKCAAVHQKNLYISTACKLNFQ